MDTTGVKVLETAEDIQDRRQQVLDRYRRFKELSIMRRQKLEDSYRFQCFRRDAEELEKWIQEKLQIASDENYKDPSNLQVLGLNKLLLGLCRRTWVIRSDTSLVLVSVTQGKLQKHQAFEAEVQANAGTIVKLDEIGNMMISEGHFASETIRVRCTCACCHLMLIDLPIVDPLHLIQSYTPYRTQQRPIVTSVNMAEYIHVGAVDASFL